MPWLAPTELLVSAPFPALAFPDLPFCLEVEVEPNEAEPPDKPHQAAVDELDEEDEHEDDDTEAEADPPTMRLA